MVTEKKKTVTCFLHLFVDSADGTMTATCYPRDELVTIGSSPTGRGKHFGKNSPRLCLPRDGSVTPLL